MLAAFLFLSAPADAASTIYKLSVQGTIASYEATDALSNPVALPSSVGIGDAFSIDLIFDPSQFVSPPVYVPQIPANLYMGWMGASTVSLGGYNYSATRGNGIVLIGNDRVLNGTSSPADLFGLSSITTTLAPPVDLGPPVSLFTFSFQAVDTTAAALSNETVSAFAPLTDFDQNFANLTFQNLSGTLRANYSGTVTRASLTAVSSVPEPSTWIMMMIGFGMIGRAVRMRSAKVGTFSV